MALFYTLIQALPEHLSTSRNSPITAAINFTKQASILFSTPCDFELQGEKNPLKRGFKVISLTKRE
ncbi:MAG TPA: hypothetical protein GX730_04405 [Chloroflexi bacterium]|nr:hypothetical protein [Chloroflexota bacterium]